MDSTYRKLINDIKDKSQQGLIAWTPSSYANTYEAPLGQGAITISFNDADVLPYNIPLISLSFLNDRGEIFNSVDCHASNDENFESLREIYNAAHNSYMKIDETLKSMLDDLNSRK